MINIKDLTVFYGDKKVLENLNLDIEKNKITAILGESGSGKTTLLNAVAGVIDYEGEIKKESERLSVVFQKDRLIKNLTAKENLKLFCEKNDVSELLESVGLSGCEDLYVKNLSAGMSRRVAILRAIYFPCDVLLLDEPFINLDLALKFSLMEKIKKQKDKTVLFVTHDVKEAASFSDRVVVLANGKIVKDIKKINEKTEEELFGLMMNIKSLS